MIREGTRLVILWSRHLANTIIENATPRGQIPCYFVVALSNEPHLPENTDPRATCLAVFAT